MDSHFMTGLYVVGGIILVIYFIIICSKTSNSMQTESSAKEFVKLQTDLGEPLHIASCTYQGNYPPYPKSSFGALAIFENKVSFIQPNSPEQSFIIPFELIKNVTYGIGRGEDLIGNSYYDLYIYFSDRVLLITKADFTFDNEGEVRKFEEKFNFSYYHWKSTQ